MTSFQAILMGIIQGLTEFLPVSSSGHLAIIRSLSGAEMEGGVLCMWRLLLQFVPYIIRMWEGL